jgi:hypothetical protein
MDQRFDALGILHYDGPLAPLFKGPGGGTATRQIGQEYSVLFATNSADYILSLNAPCLLAR